MVLKKRLDYGFKGFQFPTIPTAPRSVRRWNLHKKTDSQICAIELLASIAGKLLQESESPASSNASEIKEQLVIGEDVIRQELQDVDKLVKAECIDKNSCEDRANVSELAKGCQCPESDAGSEPTSIVTSCDCSEKVSSDVKSVICRNETAVVNFPSKVEGGSPDFGKSCNLENAINREQEADELKSGRVTITNTCSSKDPMELYVKFPVMVNSDSNVGLPLCRDPVPFASFSRHRSNIKLGTRDDDERFRRCNKPSTKLRAFRPPPRIGDRRIKALLTSRYWKVAPKLKDIEHSKDDGGIRPLYHKWKTCYNRVRYQHDTLYKRRKFHQRSVVTSDGGFGSESVSNSLKKGTSGDKSESAAMLHGARAVPSSVIGPMASFHSKDSHVKFSIKSFRVPELFIEVPETATIGSLKRTIMEEINAILGGGLGVGVLLQGKKVKDDNRTLWQTGISCKDNLDALGFTLEPNPVQTPPVCSEDLSLSLPCDTSQPLNRLSGTPVIDSGISDSLSEPPLLTNSSNYIDSNHEFFASHTDILTDETMSDSRAIVAVPAVNVEALAMIPMNRKTKRSELAQRRIRRPFSVSEVEALVLAVEELGTGRWRDVKICAFENADHRTYVDLKDKWKTLVHTSRISPQQRRGEPVPQELLDRVLSAHAYWSQHQAKHVGKHQAGPLKTTEAQADRIGVEGIQLL